LEATVHPSIRLAAPAAILLALYAPASAQTPPGPAATRAILFSDLQGAEIRDSADQHVATLEDVIVDAEGRIVEVVLGEGGVLGIGRKLHLLDAAQLPDLGRVPVPAGSLTPDQVAALPLYDADDPPDSVGPVPAAPAQTARPAASDGPEAPATPTAPIAAAPSDNARASGTTSVEGEKSVAGSGSGGMVPQQGTGSGATQVAPAANENVARADDGNPAITPEQARLNQEYGRDKQPADGPMPQSSADQAAMPPASGGPIAATPAAAGAPSVRWRLGDLVDADVKGKQDGIEIEDFRIEGHRVVDVILSKSIEATSDDLRAVSFDALTVGGDADDPEVALRPSAGGRPIAPVPEAVGK
jgi:hypothetical protein